MIGEMTVLEQLADGRVFRLQLARMKNLTTVARPHLTVPWLRRMCSLWASVREMCFYSFLSTELSTRMIQTGAQNRQRNATAYEEHAAFGSTQLPWRRRRHPLREHAERRMMTVFPTSSVWC